MTTATTIIPTRPIPLEPVNLDGNVPVSGWVSDTTILDANVVDLVAVRAGWTATSWRGRLLYLAAWVGDAEPDQAERYRRAAAMLGGVEGDAVRRLPAARNENQEVNE